MEEELMWKPIVMMALVVLVLSGCQAMIQIVPLVG
tara:strand:- start:4488 stop:4592 length:105 start_codon:yes stop_codon:yes gene_type:complete